MDNLIQEFNKSLHTGYINKIVTSNHEYQPELLVNQKNPPRKVLTTILHEFEKCKEFHISVAFVTTSGVAVIINKLNELEERGIKGQILVSQYLNFTQPEALKKLIKFKNLDVRIAVTGNTHTKGYIFKNNDYYNLIVGSSNLTAQALSSNKEWNIKISALEESGIVEKTMKEFYTDFNKATPVTIGFISDYEKIYQRQSIINIEKDHEIKRQPNQIITPNSMQIDALANLEKLRKLEKNKALLISATGTGKTYLSAFDAQAFGAKKLLFVVHRLNIAKESLKTFRSVFGKSKTMGLFSGSQRDLDCDFLFSTIQTISQNNHLENFAKNHFDYIVIDESHRSGANSYLRLIKYFKPGFLLGMTATPERTDGDDIFRLFDHNIAYEIRLNRAMEEDMLSSFHYYGVTDLYIEMEKVEKKSNFNLLITDERVDRIIEKAEFYGSDNGVTRGLVFCSRKDEAIELSEKFNLRGFKTVALTGNSSDSQRSKSIEMLESDNRHEKLDYIFTVDIFNEGIDIPKINQIIMLRPTISAIIFIQQLGRGLRKAEGKGYLTVIDFIGNYENNYLIPIALYGDTSYNKDVLRKLMSEGSRMIPGSSSINFDKISREKIFQSIDSANMRLLADLKKDYNLLKFKIGRVPMMMDFIVHGSRDPFLFVEYDGSYYNFVQRVEADFGQSLSNHLKKILELFSKEINNSKRIEESLILKLLIESSYLSVNYLKEFVFKKYGYRITDDTINSCIINLNFSFIREKRDSKMLPVKEIYNLDILSIQEGSFVFSNTFLAYLENLEFKNYLLDSTDYSIYEFDRLFDSDKWRSGFVLYRKYSRKDVFRILNFEENPIAQNVGGYLVSPNNEHCPIFVNYHKEEHISESTKYEDEFVNNKEFDWMSKSNRTLKSNDVQSILGYNGNIRLPLFIKKNNDEGLDFYFIGDVLPSLKEVNQTTILNDNKKELSIVKIRFNLIDPVTANIYEYLQEKVFYKDSKLLNSKLDFENGKSNKTIGEIKNPIPLYDFYAAAGSFSEMQFEKNYTFIEGPENSNFKNLFACKIIGDSMNRVIPNGSICLFKPYTGGSRDGKIVLVENREIQDLDFNSSFTIKKYTSNKLITENGWEHVSIVLKPSSFDKSFKDIIINEENAQQMRVIGEFVGVLKGD